MTTMTRLTGGAIFAAALAAITAGAWHVRAAEAPGAAPKKLDMRVLELEGKVKALELQLQMLQATVEKLPKPGMQPAGRAVLTTP